MPRSLHPSVAHRGEAIVEYPPATLHAVLGGREGVAALIHDLYRRIEADPLLRRVFDTFNAAAATPFFEQWFGGARHYSDESDGGLVRRHQHRHISPQAAAAWLRCMKAALTARNIETEPIMRPLARIAKAMIHSPETDADKLCVSCGLVQDEQQMRLDALLEDVGKGRTEAVAAALNRDPTLLAKRGTNQRTVAWMAVYRNRPTILALALNAGPDTDVRSPGCDPLHATLACDVVHLGTAVSVTPLALAKKWRPPMVAPLLERGAVDDVYSAAWLGDRTALKAQLDRAPELLDAPDPADDFQEVTLLAHAIAGGHLDTAQWLIDRGATVARHSGKLLTLAVVQDRVDLVALLLKHGADVNRVNRLGRLDDATRPVADLLVAHGMRVPPWMLPRACRADVSSNEVHRVSVLLGYGANVNDRGQYGCTALHYAVRGGKPPLVALLSERGADANLRDDEGLTPLLHLAKTRSKADPLPVLELLLAHGADVNARDAKRLTLLTYFERQKRGAAVRWLVARGAVR